MKKDFDLLKVGTEVVLRDGTPTTISQSLIVRPVEDYYMDAWDYVTKKHPEWDFSDGEPWDYDSRFQYFVYDEWGSQYVVLDISQMTPEEIDWESDRVYIDTNDLLSYQTWFDERIPELSEIDIPRDIQDLSQEELRGMFDEISFGSCFLSDYANSYHVVRDEVCDYADGFLDFLDEEYGEENSDKHLTPKEWAIYVSNC